MKINQIINETTTSGSVATVDSPIGATQSRGNPSIYGGKKVGSMFKGKKTNKPFANSLTESQMKDLAYDLENMRPAEFQKKYGKSREEMKASPINKPAQPQKSVPPVNEAELQEDDIIMVPGQGKKLKPGFIAKSADRTDHEVEMARSDLFSAAQNAQKVFAMIKDVSEDEGLDGWVQEKIIKANDYLNTIREYLEGKQLQHESKFGSGVIGNGAMGEGANVDISTEVQYPKWQMGLPVFVKHIGQRGTIASLAGENAIVNVGLRQYRVPLTDLKRYPTKGVAEGAKVDRMVKHIEKSEKKLGKSEKEAENIAWATANKRGMLDNKNKKA